jgi:hypothetical protein
VKRSHTLYAGASTMLLVGCIKVFETLFSLRAAFQLNGVLLTGNPFFFAAYAGPHARKLA